MLKRAVYMMFCLLLISCSACGPSLTSSKQALVLEPQSLVRWYAEEKALEIHAVIANPTDKDVSFAAYIVFLNPHLRNKDGLKRVEIKADDRNGATPFLLQPGQETMVEHVFYTTKTMERAWLSKGVGIEIAADGKRYTLPIRYAEIEELP